jgi:cytochrome c peroxidase
MIELPDIHPDARKVPVKKTPYLMMAVAMIASLFLLGAYAVQAQETAEDADLIALGKALFFDANLSVNGQQSCASCHGPEAGFAGPESLVNLETAVYHGAIDTRFGNRKPPAATYTGDSPLLHLDEDLEKWAGGMFWDGRATGNTLGDPLAEQAQGPFLNPLEQAMPNARLLVARVAGSDYADLFRAVWGPDSLSMRDVDGAYERIARSIAAYERSGEASPFSSKFDLFWDKAAAAGLDVTQIRCAGDAMGPCGGMGGGGGGMGPGGGGGMGPGGGGGGMGPGGGGGGTTDPYLWTNYRNLGLSDQELQGLAAFNDPNRANCASCHSLAPGADGYPLFTNFGYDNLGIPRNPDNPFYTMPPAWNPDGDAWIDYGLGAFLQSAGYDEAVYDLEMGKFKIPSVRNVDLRPAEDFVKAYGHNGYFKSLEEIILFYAWRGLTMNGGLGLGGSGMDCGMMGGGGMGGGGDMGMMCDPNLFPPPEVAENLTPMNHFNMMDQNTILAFLKTLSDGYFQR